MICVPIVSTTTEQVLKDLETALPWADLIEFRVDLMVDSPDLSKLINACPKPCIVTNRTKQEGGQFKGSEEERTTILKQAMDAGADYIDIEASTPKEFLKPILESTGSTQKILSYHDFSRTHDRLDDIYDTMCQLPADVVKIVTYAMDLNDNLQIFRLLHRAKKEEQKLISFCMGEKGEISRILSPLMGGFLTFGSLATGKESAPGQILASTLKDVYRVDQIRPEMKWFGVIGDPVSKSMGYLIHNRAFKETGLPHIYLPFWVLNLQKFFSGFEPFFEGLSVTMPYKEDIMPLLDEIDPLAKKIGAVNTVVREGSRWKGYNTDVSGAMRALEAFTKIKDKRVLIIGAGGTAKAIGHGVSEKGGRLTVTYNQNKERGEALARELNCELRAMRDIEHCECDILINCSPVGMSPKVAESPVPQRFLKPGMVVFDSVYNPPETRLIKDAKLAGCQTIAGPELFLNQGADQFEMWTGEKAPLQAMREVLFEKLFPKDG